MTWLYGKTDNFAMRLIRGAYIENEDLKCYIHSLE